MSKLNKQCKVCNNSFSKRYNESWKQWGSRVFCSQKCYRESRRNPNNNGITFQCSTCKEVKPKKDFVRSRNRRTGYSTYCKECTNLTNREKYKDPSFKGWKDKYSKENYEPARNMAYKKRKELMKDRCEKCGVTGKLQMHHPDYSKPLDVQTLCAQCHSDITWNYA